MKLSANIVLSTQRTWKYNTVKYSNGFNYIHLDSNISKSCLNKSKNYIHKTSYKHWKILNYKPILPNTVNLIVSNVKKKSDQFDCFLRCECWVFYKTDFPGRSGRHIIFLFYSIFGNRIKTFNCSCYIIKTIIIRTTNPSWSSSSFSPFLPSAMFLHQLQTSIFENYKPWWICSYFWIQSQFLEMPQKVFFKTTFFYTFGLITPTCHRARRATLALRRS